MNVFRLRNLVAIVAAVAWLPLVAHPAAAHNPFPAQFYNPVGTDAAGVLVLEDTFLISSDTVDLDEGPCSADSISLQQGSPNAASLRVNSFDTRHVIQLSRTGPLYRAELEVTNAPVVGLYSAASKTFAISGVEIQATIHQDDNGSCTIDAGDDFVCDLDVVVDIDGSFTGTGHDAGDTYKLDVTTPQTIASSVGCGAPFSTYLDGVVSTTTSGGDDLDLMIT